MKKLLTTYLFILFATALTAQQKNNGIRFFNGTWDALLEKAAKTNKLIFVDVYTSWCGPCKYMDKFVFTDAVVGATYNTNFINYRLDAEKGEGIALAKRFGVAAYPTFLYLNAGGFLIQKTVGEKEPKPFHALAGEAKKHATDTSNPGNLELRFTQGDQSPAFLRYYLERLTSEHLDNSIVLDAYFKTIPPETLEQDSTLLFLGHHINSTNTAALSFFIHHYDQLSAANKQILTPQLFETLVRYGAGAALKEKRLQEYLQLVSFGRRLYELNDKQREFLTRLDLNYGQLVRDYALVKKAGTALASAPFLAATDSIHQEDQRRYNELMKPYLSGERDSTKVPGFAEERQMITNLCTREITEQLYTASRAFLELPAFEIQARKIGYTWAKRCDELSPETPVFRDLLQGWEQMAQR